MNPPGQPTAVQPPPDTVPALVGGLCEKLEHDLSQLAWLLAGQPETFPADTIATVLKLAATLHEITRLLRR